MPTNTSTKAHRINVEKVIIAFMLTDTTTGCTYETPISIGKAMQIQFTPKLATGTLYGDGVITEDIALMTGADITLGANKIPIETIAKMYGHDYINGIMVEKKGDEPVPFALGYEIPQSNGKREYAWVLKCTAQPSTEDTKQRETNINFSTDSIKITAKPREYDGALRFKADTANADFTGASTFMAAVPTAIPTATTPVTP